MSEKWAAWSVVVLCSEGLATRSTVVLSQRSLPTVALHVYECALKINVLYSIMQNEKFRLGTAAPRQQDVLSVRR